jgi:hypothetical protein
MSVSGTLTEAHRALVHPSRSLLDAAGQNSQNSSKCPRVAVFVPLFHHKHARNHPLLQLG